MPVRHPMTRPLQEVNLTALAGELGVAVLVVDGDELMATDATGQPVDLAAAAVAAAVQAHVRTPTPGEVLRDRVVAALAANVAYLDLAAPTPAQDRAQLRALTRQCTALIRMVLRLTDRTDGT